MVLIKLVKEEEGQLRAKKKEKHQPHSTQQSKREEENRRSKNNTKFLTAISSRGTVPVPVHPVLRTVLIIILKLLKNPVQVQVIIGRVRAPGTATPGFY